MVTPGVLAGYHNDLSKKQVVIETLLIGLQRCLPDNHINTNSVLTKIEAHVPEGRYRSGATLVVHNQLIRAHHLPFLPTKHRLIRPLEIGTLGHAFLFICLIQHVDQ